MKTYNNHPQWMRKPMRLTKEQKKNPVSALEDFFQCYHLNEVRELLWNWLVEVISSPRSISAEPMQRNNSIFFYENLETAVEAAFVINRKAQKQLLKQKNKDDKVESNNQKSDSMIHAPTLETTSSNESYQKHEILNYYGDPLTCSA